MNTRRRRRTTDLTFGTWNVQTMLQPGKKKRPRPRPRPTPGCSTTEEEEEDMYEGESNENLKSAIRIRNTTRLSFKLATVILMV